MPKFLDALFGKPDLDRYAEDVRRLFEKRGIGPLTYHPEQQELRGVGSGTYYLGNGFSDYARAAKADRPRVLERFVEGLAAGKTGPPEDYASARAQLMPILRTSSEGALAELQLRRSDDASAANPVKLDLACRPFVEGLVVGLAYDTPHSMQRLSFQQLDRWGVTFEQALADAVQNLRALPEHGGWKRLAGGVWSGEWGDSYESSRLLLPDLIHRLGIDDPVACVPVREVIIVASARDKTALAEMARLSREAVETRPRWLNSRPLQLVGDAWQLFQPAEGLPQDFANWHTLASAGTYNDQKANLEAIYAKERNDVFVAKVLLFKNDDGRVSSVATWTQGVDTLLPEAERIAFVRPGDGAPETAMVRWSEACPLVSGLMTTTDLEPARYRVSAFPDDATWSQLLRMSGRKADS